MQANKQKAYIALAITSIVWGTTWVGSKICVRYTPAFEVAAIRQFSGGIIYVLFFLIKGEKLPTLKQLGWLTIMAILMFVSSNGLATVGLKYIPSGLGALIAALYPLFVVLIEMIFFKNKQIKASTFLGLFLGIAGIAVVFYDNAFHNHKEGFWIGVAVSMVAMITWAMHWVGKCCLVLLSCMALPLPLAISSLLAQFLLKPGPHWLIWLGQDPLLLLLRLSIP
jgi:drug/metabolite transporter (DMT)-like permease